MKLLNDQADHYLCYYTLVVDSYSRFCDVGCVYCYAYDFTPEQRGSLDLSELKSAFERAFNSDDETYWSRILRKRIPVRLGFETDPFQEQEKKNQVTKELLKLFRQYEYPHIIFTKSTLILEEDYLELLDPKLSYVQVSISSTEAERARQVERNAPSPQERLGIIRTLQDKGIDCAIRFNILPSSLRKKSDRDYLLDVKEFLKFSRARKIILNEIHYRKNEKIDVFHLPITTYQEWTNELAGEGSHLSYCYLGGESSRFFQYENPTCSNCCQCDLTNQNTRNAVSIRTSMKNYSFPKNLLHAFNLILLKALMSLVKRASK